MTQTQLEKIYISHQNTCPYCKNTDTCKQPVLDSKTGEWNDLQYCYCCKGAFTPKKLNEENLNKFVKFLAFQHEMTQ